MGFIQLEPRFARHVTDGDSPPAGIDGVHRSLAHVGRQSIALDTAARPNCRRRRDINTTAAAIGSPNYGDGGSAALEFCGSGKSDEWERSKIVELGGFKWFAREMRFWGNSEEVGGHGCHFWLFQCLLFVSAEVFGHG